MIYANSSFNSSSSVSNTVFCNSSTLSFIVAVSIALLTPSLNSQITTTTSPVVSYSIPNFRDYLTPFQLIFGVSSRQTATHLIVSKSDFITLNASLNNTAESLLVGLLIRALASTPYPNEKLEPSLWGVVVRNNFKTHTVLIKLNNLLNKLDTYEIQDYDEVIKPMDY